MAYFDLWRLLGSPRTMLSSAGTVIVNRYQGFRNVDVFLFN